MNRKEFQEQSRAFCKLINRPENFITEAADLWDDTFAISFLETRHRIKEIARRNLSLVNDAVQVGKLDDAAVRRRPRSIYVFVDDDDWIDPTITESLQSAQRRNEGIVWGEVILGAGPRGLFTFREIQDQCFTVNYAVTTKYFRTPSNSIEKVYQHFRADRTFKKLPRKVLPKYLGAYNRHPCSTVSLERAFKNGMNHGALLNSIELYLDACRAPDPDQLRRVPWVATPLEETKQLFEEVVAGTRT